jgi:hypothetical protein
MKSFTQKKVASQKQQSIVQSASTYAKGWANELKKSLCLGRLIWIQSPDHSDSVHYAKRVLNVLGIANGEMPYLSAAEFLFCCRFGFLFHMTVRSRVLLVGEISRLDQENQRELMKYLKKTLEFKMMYELNVVLVGSKGDGLNCDWSPAKPWVVQPFADYVKPELNEIIQDWLEEASVQFGKKVHRMSEEAADSIELLMIRKGGEFVKALIFQMVKSVKGRAICWSDLELALVKNELDLADINLVSEKNDAF